MIVIRPAAMSDLSPLLELAGLAGAGLTTLPRDKDLLKKRIDKSIKSFAAETDRPGGEAYLFLMEDMAAKRVVGACGVVSKVGGFQPFYSYRIDRQLFESKAINIRKEVPILNLVAEHDGPCEVGSLFLHPDYRGGGNGRFLQFVRFLFIAERPEVFEATVVSELRGVLDEQGRSPFWDALGRHFFGIDFAEADRLSVINKKFIAELMPKHPIYIPLLPKDAQDVIGKTHKDGVRAANNLEEEGFTFAGMVDIFDAGPVMKLWRDDIRTIKQSRVAKVAAVTDQKITSPMFMIGSSRPDFLACKAEIDTTHPEGIRITGETSAALKVHVGDTVRFVELFPANRDTGVSPVRCSHGRDAHVTDRINHAMSNGAETSFRSIDPATGAVVWEGHVATAAEIDVAVQKARDAFPAWADRPISERALVLQSFGDQLKKHHAEFTETICRETGKPRWEAGTETDAMINKITATIEAHGQRRQSTSLHIAGATAATHFKPHGVVAVLGPFNFPGHLPNGHIMPALLAGNTVVFKPSELTPLVGQRTAEIWQEAGLPAGVLNVVQGARETGKLLVEHPGIVGILFTGSFEAGRAINRALADQPGKIVALEMGGNNPLVVHKVKNIAAAAYWTIQSAYITAGQRCSCARRLIVIDGNDSTIFLEQLTSMIGRIKVGRYTDDPEPFMGPVISDAAAAKLLAAQQNLIRQGGRPIIEMKSIGPRPAMLSPGFIDVTGIAECADEELFGPLLQVIRVRDFDEALCEANHTRFGLTAGLFSDDQGIWKKFYHCVRAGVVNWNRALTGASSQLPFGGVGCSGNHRPSASFAADYCSYPVASMEVDYLNLPEKPTPGIQIK